jgi:hypothetical protein
MALRLSEGARREGIVVRVGWAWFSYPDPVNRLNTGCEILEAPL